MVRCLRCERVIESTPEYKTVSCPCRAVEISGGHTQLIRSGLWDMYLELTEFDVDGKIVSFDELHHPIRAAPEEMEIPEIANMTLGLLYDLMGRDFVYTPRIDQVYSGTGAVEQLLRLRYIMLGKQNNKTSYYYITEAGKEYLRKLILRGLKANAKVGAK